MTHLARAMPVLQFRDSELPKHVNIKSPMPAIPRCLLLATETGSTAYTRPFELTDRFTMSVIM